MMMKNMEMIYGNLATVRREDRTVV